ncbi:Endochitinase [Folsomia candida]|uniref:Endochitinase n=1 Tax=Folsomia candida TaxID=158441 RepID=A0A226F2P5_FOLCA|nr:Endochitinase [Folsomia candida]
MRPILISIFLQIISSSNLISGETLTFTECGAKLPIQSSGSSAVYDGFDTIYLIAGFGNGSDLTDVLKYSIYNDSIQVVSQLPEGHYTGCGFRAADGSLIYAGGYMSDSVFVTANETGPWSFLSTLPGEYGYSGCIKHDPWSATILGGWSTSGSIMELDLRTGSTQQITTDGLDNSCVLTNAVWNPETQNATVFCSVASYVGGSVLSYHRPSGATSQILRYTKSFHNSAVGFDGVNAYVIGGWHSEGLPAWGNEILMFHTTTHETRVVDVAGIPSWNGSIFDASTVTYVPYLNRLYLFGGRSDLFKNLDTIWYVDLDPVNPIEQPTHPDPEIFSCQDKSPGLYPHPTDCAMSIACRPDDDMFVARCASPFLYDPVFKSCNLPELVDCELTCQDRIDGAYPHPHDCSLYINCANNEMSVIKCPPPTLFDPILQVCNFPEFVDCAMSR